MHRLNGKPMTMFGLILMVTVMGYALLSVTLAPAQAPSLPSDLEPVRAALEKYRDFVVAIHDGYHSTLFCVEFHHPPASGRLPYPPGGMGIHFVNRALIGPVPDPMRPTILLYEPDGDKLRLIGAEWFIPLATGIKERPTLFGQPFEGPMEGHYPLQPRVLHHYDLHVWLFKPNPAGLFSPTNPTVKCSGYGHVEAAEGPIPVPHSKP